MPGADFWGNRVRESDRDTLKALYAASPGEAGAFSCDYRSTGTDGGVRWLRDFVRVDDKRASGITVDITWCRLRDKAAAQAAKVEALTRLSGRVVHDCNNLLMIAAGHGEELLHGLAPDDPLRGNAQQILTATDRLAKMTRSLSTYVKHPSPEPQSFAIDPLIGDLKKELRESLRSDIDLQVHAGAPAAMVEGDPALIVHTIRTLVERASAHMIGAGRIAIETALVRSAAGAPDAANGLAPGTYARIVVRDNAHAIHPDILTHLFEPQIATDLEPFGLPALYKSIREMAICKPKASSPKVPPSSRSCCAAVLRWPGGKSSCRPWSRRSRVRKRS